MSTEVTVIAGGDSSVVTAAPAISGAESRASGPQKGAIYRIAADGDWTTVWESPDDVPYDVLVEPGGSLLVGTGAKGKLYRLSGDPVLATLVTRADAQQITALADDGAGGILLAASNPGRLLRLSSKPAPTGSYVSDVRDTTTVATWGTIRWQATTPPGRRSRCTPAPATRARRMRRGVRGRGRTPPRWARTSTARRRATCNGRPC